jgi:hypothetical protein
VLYVAASAIAPLVLKTAPSDLDLYFWPSAETVVAGHPLLIYAAGLHHLYANDNGPLGLVPLVPMAALANAFGWAGSLTGRAALSGAVTSLFALLLAFQAVRFTAAARGDVRRPLAIAATVALAPALWIAVLDYGHVEQPLEVCLVLLAVTCALRNRSVLSGVALGASVLTRTIAGFCAIPLLLVVFATRGARATGTLAAAALVTIVIGILPFVLGDEQAVVHSLLTYRNGLPIAGGSFWIVAREASWSGILQWGDVYVGAAVAIALVLIVLWRRPAAATTRAGVMGLVTIASCCLPLFAKTVFPYYFFEPYVFSVLWWLARPGTAINWRALVPLLLTIDVFVVMEALNAPFSSAGAVESVVASIVLGAAIALVMVDVLQARGPVPAVRPVRDERLEPTMSMVQDPR